MDQQRAKSIESCLVITVGFLGLYLWLKNPWFLRLAFMVGTLGAFWPWAAQWIHRGWWGLAHVLGWINGRILLSAVFLIILTPIAWLARRFKAVGLQLRKNPPAESYYTERNHLYDPKDLENSF